MTRFLLIIIASLFMASVAFSQTTITAYYKDFDWIAMHPIGEKVNEKNEQFPIRVIMDKDGSILEVKYFKYRSHLFDLHRIKNYPYIRRVMGHGNYLPVYRTNLFLSFPGQYLIPMNDTMTFVYNENDLSIITKSNDSHCLRISQHHINSRRETFPKDFDEGVPHYDLDTTTTWREENSWWELNKLQTIKECMPKEFALTPKEFVVFKEYSIKKSTKRKRIDFFMDPTHNFKKPYKMPKGSLFKDGSLFNYIAIYGSFW